MSGDQKRSQLFPIVISLLFGKAVSRIAVEVPRQVPNAGLQPGNLQLLQVPMELTWSSSSITSPESTCFVALLYVYRCYTSSFPYKPVDELLQISTTAGSQISHDADWLCNTGGRRDQIQGKLQHCCHSGQMFSSYSLKTDTRSLLVHCNRVSLKLRMTRPLIRITKPWRAVYPRRHTSG